MIKSHSILICCSKLTIVHKKKSKKKKPKKFTSKKQVTSFLEITLITTMIRIMLNWKVLLMHPLTKGVLKIKEFNQSMQITVNTVNCNLSTNFRPTWPSILKKEKEVKEVKCLSLMDKISILKHNTTTKL